MSQLVDIARHQHRTAPAPRNAACGFHPVSRLQVVKTRFGALQNQPIGRPVLNSQVVRVRRQNRPRVHLPADHYLPAFINRRKIPPGARTGLLQAYAGLGRRTTGPEQPAQNP